MISEKVITDAKYSVRSVDENGYLHVEMTPISKATVNPYKGSELQGLTDVKLEPNRIYYGYRDPKELEKGANTFNGLFLLDEHHDIDATSIPKEFIIGTVGTDAHYKDGYLYNSLVIADQDAINSVEDKSKWEISSAYKFVPVFKDGEVETEGGEKIHYDFIMTDIRGNHVALVPEGRAGHDVRVADSKGEINKVKKPINCTCELKCELCDKAEIKSLQEIVDRIDGLGLDVTVESTSKNQAGNIIGVILKNEVHTFSVFYDEVGCMQINELISDKDACTVQHAYMKGQEEANKQHCEQERMEAMAQEMAETKKVEPAFVPPITPSAADLPIMKNIEMSPIEAAAPKALTEEDVAIIVGTPAVVADEELSEVQELEHKEDEFTEKAFVDIQNHFKNARFNDVDAFIKEIGKFGVVVGKITVVESGTSYSAKCEKGQKTFTVDFKQTPSCIEIFKVYDENQIAENELNAEQSPLPTIETESKVSEDDGEGVEQANQETLLANPAGEEKIAKKGEEKEEPKDEHKKVIVKKKTKIVKEDDEPAQKMEKAKIIVKRPNEKPVKISKTKVTTDKKTTKAKTKKVAEDEFPPKNMPKKKHGKKTVKDGNYGHGGRQGSLGGTVTSDGGKGSGRKKGSKNGVHMNPQPVQYPTSKPKVDPSFTSEKLGMTFTPREKAAIKQKAAPIRERLASNATEKHSTKALGQQMDLKHRAKGTANPETREKERNMGKVWRRATMNLDTKKKVKGCVGDADIQQDEGLVTDVFGLLMSVLDDNFNVADGGPGSGNFGHSGRPGQKGGSGEGGTNNNADDDDDAKFEAWQEKYGGNYKDSDEAFAAFEQGLEGEPLGTGLEDYY